MIRGNSHHRRPDPLLLLAAAVVLCAVMTTAATAGESFNFFPKPHSSYRLDPEDNGFIVASMDRSGGLVNVSLTPPRGLPHDFLDGQESAKNQETLSSVFLFLRYPW